MGAWDVTAFGNDDAADWSDDLMDAESPAAFLETTLAMAKRGGYLEVSDGCQLVAAAAVIAAACGAKSDGLPGDVRDWLRGKEAGLKRLAPAARTAIQRVRGEESELREVWQESDEFAEWSADLDAIAAGL
jgi:hypothetical protein